MKVLLFSLILLCNPVFVAHAQSINDLLVSLEGTEKPEEKRNIYKQIAYTYQKEEAYAKSSEYLQKAYQLEDNTDEKVALQENIGRNQLALKNYSQSLSAFEQAYQLAETPSQRTILATMVTIANQQGDVSKAISYNEKLLTLDRAAGDEIKTAQTLNNMAVLYQANQQGTEAQQHFQEALVLNENLYKQDRKLPIAQQNSQILNNMATLHNYMGNYSKAMEYLNKAENLENKQLRPKELAKTQNLKGITYYLQGNNDKARDEVNKALEIGEKMNDKLLLAESYRILSEIETSEGNSQEAQENLKQSLKLQDEIRAEESQKQKNLLDKQIEAEKRENQTLQLIAENQRKALELEQTKLESEKQQQALELQQQQLASLERDKELQRTRLENQQLEKQRVQQALAIANQNLERERQEKELADLQQQREVEAKEQQLKNVKQQQELERIEAEQKLQEQQLEQQKSQQVFTNIIIIAGALTLVVILFFLYQNSKKNKKLTTQKQQLDVKNEELSASEEELRQNMEELQSTQEAIAKQNLELASKNRVVIESIQTAQIIQTAILPTRTQMNTAFPNNFILFLPRDIVSGDFFWIYENEDVKFMAVVDCTGHGVPGAFMSLVGSDLLTEIIEIRGERNPAAVLQKLNIGVRKKLSQEEGLSDAGMDLSLCKFEKADNSNLKVTFAGAKGKVFIVHKGKTQQLAGDRKSIGGKHNQDIIEFTNHELELEKDSMLYLLTDGYVDQANQARKRFSSARLKKILVEIATLPLAEQKKKMEDALKTHQGKELQRDDITVMGIRI